MTIGLNRDELRQAALAYLAEQIRDRAPAGLRLEAEVDERPLEGEGAAAVFSFELEPAAKAGSEPPSPVARKHYVVVGQTEPNYFPAYGLDADDAYSFHIGTRFVLEMGMQLVDASFEPPTARRLLHAALRQFAPGAALERESLAALFRCDEGLFAVYRLTLGGRDVYCMGADCPPGFYELTEHPPQVALRLHLGKLIRAEAARATPEQD